MGPLLIGEWVCAILLLVVGFPLMMWATLWANSSRRIGIRGFGLVLISTQLPWFLALSATIQGIPVQSLIPSAAAIAASIWWLRRLSAKEEH